MSGSHVTIRVPRWTLTLLALVILGAVAFWAGRTTLAPTADVTTSGVVASTTPDGTTSTTPTTVPDPRQPAGGGTPEPASLDASISVTDTCPAAGRVPGTLTVTWATTSAERIEIRLSHGADILMNNAVVVRSRGSRTFERTCNNQKLADGTYNGRPLTVTYSILVTGADGVTASDRGESSM